MKLKTIIQNQNDYSLALLYEAKYERAAVEEIIAKLGNKYGLAAARTDSNLTDTGGTDPDILAKKIGDLLNTKVTVVEPGKAIKWNPTKDNPKGKKEKISATLVGLHFKYEGKIVNLKLSKGSGNPQAPSDPAFYEMGICVEYNKLMGMDPTEAMKKADVKPKAYDPYESYLSEVCSKVVNNMPSVGKSLRQTGGDSFKVAAVWPSSDGTPKTDIYGDAKNRISVKKKGGSQLMSGKAGDAKGVFLGGKACYEKFEKKSMVKGLDKIIGSIEEDFKTFNTARSVGVIRDTTGKAYVKYRVPKINDEIRTINTKNKNKKKKIALIKLKPGQAEKMAKAEAMAAGIIGLKGNWPTWFIEGVPPIDEMTMAQWFSNYVAEQPSEDLREEISGVIAAAIDHKRLDGEVKAIFENVEFKKWCVFEAATGTFKFSGEAIKDSQKEGVANKILVFGIDGSAKLEKLNIAWAKKYAPTVDTSVNFKSSGRGKGTNLRLQAPEKISSGKVPQFSSSAKLLREVKSIVDEELVDYILNTNYILNEISFGDLKAAGKKIIKNIKSMMTKFYQKVFKRIIDKIKEYAKKGIDTFLDLLGIEISGSSDVSVNF
jgi:hypothetical protein